MQIKETLRKCMGRKKLRSIFSKVEDTTHICIEALAHAPSMTSLVPNALREISILMTLPW